MTESRDVAPEHVYGKKIEKTRWGFAEGSVRNCQSLQINDSRGLSVGQIQTLALANTF